MKKRKSILILIALSVFFLVFSGCMHRPFGGDDFPAGALEHIDDHVEDLNLTDAQNAEYLKIRAKIEAELIKNKASHDEFKTTVKNKINEENPDLKEVTALLRTKLNKMPQGISKYLDFMDEFYDILDDQQKAEILEEIRDKANSRCFQ